MSNCPFNPASLLLKSYSIDGFKENISNKWYESNAKLYFIDAVTESMNDVEDEYSDFPFDQGFGSSDMTYAVKSFIDNLINIGGFTGEYKTDFTPRLSIVKI